MRQNDPGCRKHPHPHLARPVTREDVRNELEGLYHQAGFPGRVRLEWTDELRRTHNRNHRRYAQVYPYLAKPRFQLAPQTTWLDKRHRRALLAHEVGHVLDPDGGEDDADAAAYGSLGVRIGYDHRWPGKGLQVALNPPPISFANWHHGNVDYTLYALTPEGHEELKRGVLDFPTRDMILGRMDYQVDDRYTAVHVNLVQVPESLRRQGIGTALWRELERLYPGYRFPQGWSTEEGSSLRRSVGRNPARNPGEWKSPPPCDPSKGKLKNRVPLSQLVGKRVRVHVNLHNGCYVVSHRGRVAGYTRSLKLRNVAPRVSLAGWKACNDTKVRNVHAYLEGTLVSASASKPRGWKKVTYNCKSHGPNFYFASSGKTFNGSSEVVFLNRGGEGFAQIEVLAKDSKAVASNPSCGCQLGGGACACGAVQEWWLETPPGCGC